MSKIKELFFKDAWSENRNVNREDVEKLIEYLNDIGDEGGQFDAKDFGKILDHKGRFSLDSVKTQLGKHISAMANTSGGLLAIGVKESDGADQSAFSLNNFDLGMINLQHIQRAISTAVEPKAEFYVEAVKMEEFGELGKGILLIFIEASINPPHQVVHNRTYYFRNGESSNPAPHSLVAALFHERKNPDLEIDVIKTGDAGYQRVLIRNIGNAPGHHTHIIINIFPHFYDDLELKLNKRLIERSTDGIWNIKSFIGSGSKNFMKFRFRAKPEQIILPGVNEILFDLPVVPFPNAKLMAELYCDGFEGHQEFDLFSEQS
jgi:hypothetical protein